MLSVESPVAHTRTIIVDRARGAAQKNCYFAAVGDTKTHECIYSELAGQKHTGM